MTTSQQPRRTTGPGPLTYTDDGRLLDPHRLLDTPRPPVSGRTAAWWEQRQLDTTRTDRDHRQAVITAATLLDPTDTSLDAQHLREVAAQQRAVADLDARQIEWATAALAADPNLATRLNPAIVHATTTTTTDDGIAADAATADGSAESAASAFVEPPTADDADDYGA